MADTRLKRNVDAWNRKLHIYTGLYFLLFVWLFSLTGLILNHPRWEFTRFWPDRKESSVERTVRVPPGAGDLTLAKDVMAQLDISGEVERMTTRPAEGRFDFQIVAPGKITEVKLDLETGQAKLKQTDVNAWGVLYMLHTFTGVRMGQAETRDWVATRIWSFAMDAVCLGLLFLVASSLYMWYPLRQKRAPGLISLGLGVLCCVFFLVGLEWIL